MSRTQILSSQQIEQKLTRMAWQIYETHYKEPSIVLAGINGNGFVLANRLAKLIESISTVSTLVAEVTIDKKEPFNSPISLDIKEEDFSNKVVILVDDVLNSGKTMIYGIKHFLKVPVKMIKVTALIDRKHHRFPIRTDYAGLILSTSLKDHVAVELGDNEGVFIQ